MKKRGFVFGMMAVLAAAVLVLAGCGGPKAEDVIREGVTAEFDKIKNLDDSLIDEMTSEMDDEEASAFTELGIDMKDYLKSYFAGFDYEIGEIEVDEKAGTGTVQMKASCKSLERIVTDFADQFQAKLSEVDPTNVTEDDLFKMGGQLFMDITDNAEMRDVEFTLSVEKDSDGNWGFADGVEDEIYEMLLG